MPDSIIFVGSEILIQDYHRQNEERIEKGSLFILGHYCITELVDGLVAVMSSIPTSKKGKQNIRYIFNQLL